MRVLFSVIVLAIVAAAAAAGLTVVQDYEFVVVRVLGKPANVQTHPGIQWYWPLITTISHYDIRPQEIVLNEKSGLSGSATDLQGVGSQTLDGLSVGVSVRLSYTLDPAKWRDIDFYFGADTPSETRNKIEARIKKELRHAIQALMPQYPIDYLLSHRQELTQNIKVTMGYSAEIVPAQDESGDYSRRPSIHIPAPLTGEPLKNFGIIIGDPTVSFNTPDAYDNLHNQIALEALTAKQKAQEIEHLELDKKLAESKAQIERTMALAKAEAELEMLRAKQKIPLGIAFLEKWDGRLPVVISADSALQQRLTDIVRLNLQDAIQESGSKTQAEGSARHP